MSSPSLEGASQSGRLPVGDCSRDFCHRAEAQPPPRTNPEDFCFHSWLAAGFEKQEVFEKLSFVSF